MASVGSLVPLLLAAWFAGNVPERSVRLAAVGDIQLNVSLRPAIGAPPAGPLSLVHPLLRADLTVGNLEGPLAAPVSVPAGPSRGPILTQPREAIEHLLAAGFDVLSLANNHVLDQGVPGVAHTLVELRHAGIGAVGAWLDPDDRFQPVIRTVDGVSIGFVAYTAWLNVPGRWRTVGLGSFHEDDALEQIAALRPHVDFVVVLVHWEFQNVPATYRRAREAAQALVEAGADLVLGHHPHVLRGFEWHRGALVAYSLGNFVFGSPAEAHRPTGVLSVDLRRFADGTRRIAARFLPARMEGIAGIPTPLAGGAAASALRSLDRLCRLLGARVRPDGRVLPAESDDPGRLLPRLRRLLPGTTVATAARPGPAVE
jgi:poly-gamma-glutamate synthesis protein (capsule biosynthesis protein)